MTQIKEARQVTRSSVIDIKNWTGGTLRLCRCPGWHGTKLHIPVNGNLVLCNEYDWVLQNQNGEFSRVSDKFYRENVKIDVIDADHEQLTLFGSFLSRSRV